MTEQFGVLIFTAYGPLQTEYSGHCDATSSQACSDPYWHRHRPMSQIEGFEYEVISDGQFSLI